MCCYRVVNKLVVEIMVSISRFWRCLIVCNWSISVLFVKQKTAYEMRISDWSSDVCSSDLADAALGREGVARRHEHHRMGLDQRDGLDAGMVQIGRASCRERVCQYV